MKRQINLPVNVGKAYIWESLNLDNNISSKLKVFHFRMKIIFSSHVFDNRHVFKIHETYQYIKKSIKWQINLKWAKVLNGHTFIEFVKMANKDIKRCSVLIVSGKCKSQFQWVILSHI